MTLRSKARRKKYAAISSMSELERQRAQLEVRIKKQELRILEDLDEVREHLSFSNLANLAVDSLAYRFPVVRKFRIGYRVFNSILTGRRSRNTGCCCGE